MEKFDGSDNIFDLEQGIMSCWGMVDDVKEVNAYVGDSDFFKGMAPEHEDKLMNLLLGLTELYQIKFERTFGIFQKHCMQYHTYRKFYEKNQGVDLDRPGVGQDVDQPGVPGVDLDHLVT